MTLAMVYYPLHCHLLERSFEEARQDVRDDYSGKMVRELHFKNLPLHIALQVGAPNELVIELYHAYPEAAHVKCVNGKTVLELATGTLRSEVREVLMGSCSPVSQISSNTYLRASIESFDDSLRRSNVREDFSGNNCIRASHTSSDTCPRTFVEIHHDSLQRSELREDLTGNCLRNSQNSSDTSRRASTQRSCDDSPWRSPNVMSANKRKSASTVSCDSSSSSYRYQQHPPNATIAAETTKSDKRSLAEMRALALREFLESMDTEL